VSRKYHLQLFQIAKLINRTFNKERGERERKEKKLEAHQNSDDNTISTVEKISTRQIQRYQERLLKTNEPQHLWTAHVAYSVHFFRPSLVLLNLSYRDLSNNTDDVIIRVSMCLRGLFIYFFTFFSIFSLHKLNGGERREERERKQRKKITMETHWYC
jgi:hypothetical protein